jgi:Undecaprenyl-phosphate galactose phosphotransferase WbaP
MASVSAITAVDSRPCTGLPKLGGHPYLSSVVFVVCDLMAFALTLALALLGQRAMSGGINWSSYVALWPAPAVLLAVFLSTSLYPCVIYNAVSELRRLELALTLSFLAIVALILLVPGADFPRQLLLLCWLLAMIITPGLRSVVRGVACRQSWWGVPVVMFHTGDESYEVLQELEMHPEFGLRPVAILSRTHIGRARCSLPILDLAQAAAVRAAGVDRAIIALPGAGSNRLLQDLEKFESLFPRLTIVHSSAASYSLTVDARELAGLLALDIKRDLLLPFPRFIKRFIDLLIICFSLPLVSVAILVLSVLIKLESPGPVFYGQWRVGVGHSTFRIWKLRTMQVNGDELLQQALAKDASLREEWLRTRKLRCDPRVTRVGRLLRKTSLDELPQIWNVLRGEMSLVGPRPILEEEIENYGLSFDLYCRVSPGLTGLWQVSGRNEISCRDRVRLDSYYVRNWSPWLDLYILARTAKVVLTGAGAY